MLAAEIHHALRTLVFDQDGNPAPFTLRPKANTQDDPFDEWLRDQLSANLPHTVFGASGPLISPDIAVVRRGVALSHEHPATTGEAIGIEVKKFESESARGTGLDFNSTPPCGSLTVYDVQHQPIVIPGFYLFCVLRQLAPLGAYDVTTLAMVDGDAINADKALYDHAVSPRTKAIKLGTYGDGMNRQRGMYVFANPLSWRALWGQATLIHRSPELDGHGLVRFGRIGRTEAGSKRVRWFSCYATEGDADRLGLERDAVQTLDPFAVPKRRVEATSQRGRFVLRPAR